MTPGATKTLWPKAQPSGPTTSVTGRTLTGAFLTQRTIHKNVFNVTPVHSSSALLFVSQEIVLCASGSSSIPQLSVF
ncbi:unnamed protein product [Ixodes persulcatus]